MPAAYAHYCFGKEVYKPTIGDKTREIEIEDIEKIASLAIQDKNINQKLKEIMSYKNERHYNI